jgi:hypothetical protein
MKPFGRTIDVAQEYVVSSTLDRVDRNAEPLRGDLGRSFNSSSGSRLRGCSDIVVQSTIARHGPTLLAGLSKRIDLKLMSRLAFGSGAVAMRYEPRS